MFKIICQKWHELKMPHLINWGHLYSSFLLVIRSNFLEGWKNSHVLGRYPVKVFSGVYPKPIRDYFRL